MTAIEKVHYWMLKYKVLNGALPEAKEIVGQLEMTIEEEKEALNTANAGERNLQNSDIPKYTEEQTREAIKMAREPEYWDSGSYYGELYTEDEIIDELNRDD